MAAAALFAAAAGLSAGPASAQTALSLAVNTDYRFRGASVSNGEPVAVVQLSHDDPSGLYFNSSVLGVHRSGSPALLNFLGNVGYAARLSPNVAIDGGLVHSEYRWGDLPNPSSSRTEAYAGLHVKNLAARVSYSPRYFEKGMAMVYGEVEAGFQPVDQWRISVHAGALHFLRAPFQPKPVPRYDWRLGVSRQLGALELNAALSGGGPDRGNHGATAVTAGASLTL